MRTAMPIAALALMTLGAALPAFDEPIPLKVLYAGKPNRAERPTSGPSWRRTSPKSAWAIISH